MDNLLLQNVLEGIFSTAFLASVLRVTTPILLPSLGALISDRAGVINIGLEGIMLIAALAGVVFSAQGHGVWLGLGMGVLFGGAAALVLGFFHLRLRANLILSGIALNFLGQAGTVAVMVEVTGERGTTQNSLRSLSMPNISLPDVLGEIPVVSYFFQVLDNQSVMTWAAFLAVVCVWYLLYRTPAGMHLRAVGENPEAAASVGLDVQRTRYGALVLSGILAALGGIHLSMGYLQFFQPNMTAGRGFIALAAPALGGGHPIGTGLAALVFGFFDALSYQVGTLAIPSMVPQMLPYLSTVLALVIYALQSRLAARVRVLRAAEGAGFDATFWQSIRRLSILHMFMAMIAVFGVIIGLSMVAAPNGFKGVSQSWEVSNVRWWAVAVGLVSLALITINLPFVTDVERIRRQTAASAAAAILCLWLYLGGGLALFFMTTALNDYAAPSGFTAGLVAGGLIWLALGGHYVLRAPRSPP